MIRGKQRLSMTKSLMPLSLVQSTLTQTAPPITKKTSNKQYYHAFLWDVFFCFGFFFFFVSMIFHSNDKFQHIP